MGRPADIDADQRRQEIERIERLRAELGRRIALARAFGGYATAAAFAREVGVNANTIYRWERGDNAPEWHQFDRIAEATGCTIDFLLRGYAGPSQALEAYLESPRGKLVSPATRAWLLSLPLGAIKADARLLDALAMAAEESLTPEQAALAAAVTASALRE